jgi:cytochrome c5
MKKLILSAVILLAAGIIVTLVVKTTDASSNTPLTTGSTIPDDVKKVFDNSCIGCHATGANGMAAANVNFTEWDNYPAKKQAKKATAICSAIEDKSMPPAGYVKSNPGKEVTAAQQALVCKWAQSLQGAQ